MKSASAFAPGHVTGFFYISDTASDPLQKGSLGAGFAVAAGVTTRVRLVGISPRDPLAAPGNQTLRTQVSVNGSIRRDARVSQEVVNRFVERLRATADPAMPWERELRTSLLSIEHHVRLPEGSGFGTSGAAALSLACALNSLFNAKLRREECGQIAHLAEITCGTGLGTVIGEYNGGCEIRVAPGAPGIGKIDRFDPTGHTTAVFVVYGPLATKSMLSDSTVKDRINASGRKYLDLLLAEPTGESFLRYSRAFAEGLGLVSKRVRKALELFDANGIGASMLMFGEGVFSLVHRETVPRLRRAIDRLTEDAQLVVSMIEPNGGRMIDED